MKNVIYQITNPNGHYYHGQAVDWEKRKSRYLNKNCKEQPHIYNSLVKHKPENHIFEVLLEDLDPKLLDFFEISAIWLFDSFNNPEHLNCTIGGDGVGSGENHPMFGKKRPDVSARMSGKKRPDVSARMSGDNNPMFGKTGEKSPLFGKKRPDVSARMSGENHPMFGKTGEKSPFFGKKRPDMSGDNNPMKRPEIADKFRGNKNNFKRIRLLATHIESGIATEFYDGICNIAKILGTHSSHIKSCLNGKHKSAGGYTFKKII